MATPIPVYDRVKETSATSGTGPITLSGPDACFRSFASTVGVGNQTYYGIVDNYNSEWEVGIGTLTTTTTISRDQVLSSTSGGGLVDFGDKPKAVMIAVPAAKSVTREMLGHVHTQSAPSSSWTVSHNLGRFVSVSVIDSANTEIEGDVVYIDENAVRLNFSSPFSGSAYCN